MPYTSRLLLIYSWIEAIILVLGALVIDILAKIFSPLFPKDLKSLKDKVIVITGSAGGIGVELAYQLAAHGARLALLDFNGSANAKLEEAIRAKYGSGIATAFQADVSDLASMEEVAKKIHMDPSLGDVDVLICNAGVLDVGSIGSLTESQIRRTINVNVLGVFWTVKTFLPQMIERSRGHIVLMSSMSSWAGKANMAAYSASKFAVRGIGESLVDEFAALDDNRDLKVTLAYPFFTKTPLLNGYNVVSACIPLVLPEEVVKVLIKSIRREDLEVFIPSIVSPIFRIAGIVGPRVRQITDQLLNVGISRAVQGD